MKAQSRSILSWPLLIFDKPFTLICRFVETKGSDVSEKELTVSTNIVWDAFHCYAMTWQGSSLFLFTRQSINRCTLDLAARLCVSYVHTQSLHDPIPIGGNPKALQGLWTMHYTTSYLNRHWFRLKRFFSNNSHSWPKLIFQNMSVRHWCQNCMEGKMHEKINFTLQIPWMVLKDHRECFALARHSVPIQASAYTDPSACHILIAPNNRS